MTIQDALLRAAKSQVEIFKLIHSKKDSKMTQNGSNIVHEALQQHPLYPVMLAAIQQAMGGKGQRHGGDSIPFNEQPWTHYAKMHGRGFLTGQAAKKLEEAASTRTGEAFETEILGAMVYMGMAVLAGRGSVPTKTSSSDCGGVELASKHYRDTFRPN